ncbi:MAG: hypothetical protein ACLQME_10715 [Alphaproteobacteria bacterium]
MKKETQAALNKALDAYDQMESQATKSAAQKKDELQALENQYTALRNNVIVPALKEVAAQLEARGHRCNIQTVEKDFLARIEIKPRGKEVRAATGGNIPPHFEATLNRDKRAMQLYGASPNQGGPRGDFALKDVSSNLVIEEAVRFVTEWFERGW